MRIGIVYCKNCGLKYSWQASGHYSLDTPKEYNDSEYCPECKKAIIDALAPIEKKSIVKWIETDVVDFETLKRWESEMLEERKDKFFHCTYWEEQNEVMSITTKVRVDMNDNILEYEKD